MARSPTRSRRLVNEANRGTYPRARWTQQHVRELVPTRNVRRGAGPASNLPFSPRNLDDFAFEDGAGQQTTIAKWQQDNYSDAIVVLHRGRLVYERYYNQMRPETPHLLFSVTKPFTGLIAAQLVREGKIDLDALVTQYVPELADSAWGDMKVREVMDMTGGVRFARSRPTRRRRSSRTSMPATRCRRRPATRGRRISTTSSRR